MSEVATIIPVYKEFKYLHKAIASVREQTFRVDEICIVDDGTNDPEIQKIVDSFQDSRVRLVSLAKNGGISVARNAGVQNTKSRFVSFLDSDDYWDPDKIQNQIEAQRKTQATVIGSSLIFHEDLKQSIHLPLVIPQKPIEKLFLDLFFISPSTLFLSREKFYEIGGFDEDIRFGEDWDFLLRAALLNEKFAAVPSVTHMMVHSASWSLNYFPLKDISRIRRKCLNMAKKDDRITSLMVAFSLSAMARWMHGKHSKWLEFYLLALAGATNPGVFLHGHFRGNIVNFLTSWRKKVGSSHAQ